MVIDQFPVNETGRLVRINLYPIKSLEGISVQQADVLPNGSLKHDRQYTFWSLESNHWVRAKASPELIRIHTDYDLDAGVVTLSVDESEETFHFTSPNGQAALNQWMSHYLRHKVELRESIDQGFFDESARGRYGISLISTQSIAMMCEWFPFLTSEEVIRRMRMNVTVDGFSLLWEEAMITTDRSSRIRIGNIPFRDPWPCSRCSVPARDSHTAKTDKGFAATMTICRKADTPVNGPLHALSNQDAFDGFFTLGVRTDGRDECESHVIAVGDVVTATQSCSAKS